MQEAWAKTEGGRHFEAIARRQADAPQQRFCLGSGVQVSLKGDIAPRGQRALQKGVQRVPAWGQGFALG